MLKRLLAHALAAALILAQAHPLVAWPAHGSGGVPTPPAPSCPFGSGTPNDGCAALFASGLQGTVQNTHCFDAATSVDRAACGITTATTYLSRLQENQPGVDYPVGIPASQGALTDPAVSQPAHCSYGPTASSAGGPKLTCSGAFNIVVSGYQFGPVGGHQATVLHMNGDVTGVDIENSNFDNDANTSTSSGLGDYALYAGSNVGGSYPIVFKYNTINGECPAASCANGGFQMVFYTAGAKTIDYNAFLDTPFRISAGCGSASVSCAGNAEGATHIGWNFCRCITNSFSASHGEFMIDIAAQNGSTTALGAVTYIGNVIIIPSGSAIGAATANIYVSGGGAPTGPPVYSNVTISDSTIIANKTSGSTTASALVDFQNGVFQHNTFSNVAFDVTGSGNSIRTDCGNSIWTTGTVDGTTGILTMSGHINSGGWGLTLVNSDFYQGATRLGTILSQISGTTGKDGTYNTDYRGANVGPLGMAAYGGAQTATFPNSMAFSNVQNMLAASPSNLITTVSFKNACATPYGPVPP